MASEQTNETMGKPIKGAAVTFCFSNTLGSGVITTTGLGCFAHVAAWLNYFHQQK